MLLTTSFPYLDYLAYPNFSITEYNTVLMSPNEWFLSFFSHRSDPSIPSCLDFKPLWLIYICWQLYKELSQCYQALVSSEAKLRQSHQELSSQLAQKDQQILELQAGLQQQQQEQIQLQQELQLQQQPQLTAIYPSPQKQTNFKVRTILIHYVFQKGLNDQMHKNILA